MTSTIQSSIKLGEEIHVVGGVGFDDFYQNLVAVYGGDAAQATAHITRMGQAFVPGALAFGAAQRDPEQQAISTIQQAIPGAQVIQPPAAQYAPQQQYQQPPAQPQYQQAPPQQYAAPAPRQPQAAPPGPAPVCDHGQPRTYKTGTYKSGQKTGQSYAMWKCVFPQGQDCKPIWL